MIRRNFLIGLISLGLGISGCLSNRDKPHLETMVSQEQEIDFPVSEYGFVSQIPLFKVEEQKTEFPDVSDQIREENYRESIKDDSFKTIYLSNFMSLITKKRKELFIVQDGSLYSSKPHDRFGELIRPEKFGRFFYFNGDKFYRFELNEDSQKIREFDAHSLSSQRACFTSLHSPLQDKYFCQKLVLLDIPLSKKLVITPNEEITRKDDEHYNFPVLESSLSGFFVNDSQTVLLTTSKGDVLFDINDGKVRFYHPNHFITAITPNLEGLIVFEKPQKYGEKGSFSHYGFSDKKKKHMFDEDYAFDFREFKNNVSHNHEEIELHMSPNGEFFAYNYCPRNFSAPANDRMAGIAIMMTMSRISVVKHDKVPAYTKVYDFKRGKVVNVGEDLGGGVKGIDNEGNLETFKDGKIRYHEGQYLTK